ncbi:LolA family protein [Vibrio agarivorans]|uniref:LolA family protein n=1 Tax=Vibrio agarivorans TaxID=153622 RepID=UPI002231F051|nr:outer membrane lipoprotein carrier protein LolA [Vibrio agarivorans]
MLQIARVCISMFVGLLSMSSTASELRTVPPSIEEVVELMSEHRMQAGMYRQEKTISGLSQTLQSSGQYVIDADAGIVWGQEQPFEDLLVVKGGQLFNLSDGVLVAQDVPINIVSLMTDVFSGLMSADTVNLERQFSLEYLPEGQSTEYWTVTLSPSSAPLNNVFELITISGQGGKLKQIILLERSGDRTEMTLTPLIETQASNIAHWLRG